MIDDYFALQKKIHEYFGYVEDWVVIPLVDQREYYWYLSGENPSSEILYADTSEILCNALTDSGEGRHYSAQLYTQRFLPKWVYRTDDHTLICMDTQTDGNKFLGIFDNSKMISR